MGAEDGIARFVLVQKTKFDVFFCFGDGLDRPDGMHNQAAPDTLSIGGLADDDDVIGEVEPAAFRADEITHFRGKN